MPDADQRLAISVVDERGRRLPARGLAPWLARVAPARARGALTIALVTGSRMRGLNRAYRKKDYATDVLAFPAGEPRTSRFLGEIVIAVPVARRQAREHGHSEAAELRVLALHGLLHLLGYDHERDNGQMRRVEARLRRKGGLRASLIERA